MMSSPDPLTSSSSRPDVIELRLPVAADLIVLARLTTATLAARAGFDVEEIEDLRLAVEELCLTLGPSDQRGTLHLEFFQSDHEIEISCTLEAETPGLRGADVNGVSPVPTLEDDLSDRILEALVDAHGYDTRDANPRAWLKKSRARASRADGDGPHARGPAGRLRGVRAVSQDPGLRDRLVEAHLGLAHQLARRFVNRGEPYDDLVQVASLALVKSVDRFDPERGVKFSTFATRTVIGELKRHFRDRGWAVRAPRRIQELYLELGHAVASLSQELGRSPTVPELAASVGASEEAVLETLEAAQGYRLSSIDAPDHHEETLANSIGAEDGRFTEVDNRSFLGPAMAELAPRDRIVLWLRFGEGLTQSQIAERIGVSQMQVSRLLSASLDRLRTALPSPGARVDP